MWSFWHPRSPMILFGSDLFLFSRERFLFPVVASIIATKLSPPIQESSERTFLSRSLISVIVNSSALSHCCNEKKREGGNHGSFFRFLGFFSSLSRAIESGRRGEKSCLLNPPFMVDSSNLTSVKGGEGAASRSPHSLVWYHHICGQGKLPPHYTPESTLYAPYSKEITLHFPPFDFTPRFPRPVHTYAYHRHLQRTILKTLREGEEERRKNSDAQVKLSEGR